jgi:hypothetical protein
VPSNPMSKPIPNWYGLMLARLWLILAESLDLKSSTNLSDKLQARAVEREAEQDLGH